MPTLTTKAFPKNRRGTLGGTKIFWKYCDSKA